MLAMMMELLSKILRITSNRMFEIFIVILLYTIYKKQTSYVGDDVFERKINCPLCNERIIKHGMSAIIILLLNNIMLKELP